MYQQSIFESSKRGWAFCGEGCFAEVHRSPDGKWVQKMAKAKDGTLNYLEWCVMRQRAGTALKGMPMIDTLVHTEEGYVVTMKYYADHPENLRMRRRATWCEADELTYEEAPYLAELVAEFVDYMRFMFVVPAYYEEHLDLHGGNHRFDADSASWVLLDPCASNYRPVPSLMHVANFSLQ